MIKIEIYNTMEGPQQLQQISKKLGSLAIQTHKQSDPQLELSVLGWNILADAFVSMAYFPYVQIGNLAFQNRIAKIKTLIKQRNCSILCLQQVDFQPHFFNYLTELGYDYLSRPKGTQGIVIAFKKQLFVDLGSKIIDFDSLVSDKVYKPSYQKGHGAIIVKLRTKHNKNVIIANTHLFWDPKFEKVKYHQICCVITQIKALKEPGDAVIFAGDLNSLPESNVVDLITSNDKPKLQKCVEPQNNYDQMLLKYEQVKNNLIKLKSSYSEQHGKYTNYTKEFKGRIDYIFYSDQHLEVTNIEQLPEQGSLSNEIALPNTVHPSDHVSLLTKFKFKEQQKQA